MGFIFFFIWIALCFLIGSAGGNRKIGSTAAFFVSFLLSPLVGFIVVLVSDRKEVLNHKWKEFEEIAKRAEFKGQLKEAKDAYLDALYHLEHDYPNLNSDEKQQIEATKERLRVAIEQVETKAQ